MNIIELHYQGGPLFMSILSLIFLAVIVLSAMKAYRLFSSEDQVDYQQAGISQILQLGIFAAVFGIFGQCLGLFQAFMAIEAAGDISPAMIAGGLKVSMITTLYGLFIFLISFLTWFGLKAKVAK
ncbi:MAG: hypothetical protein HKN16_05360 [Saprospiraceae bacterium]|nr:hypothetical protein [Saprospiraceae bacterium]